MRKPCARGGLPAAAAPLGCAPQPDCQGTLTTVSWRTVLPAGIVTL
jgi:hypothetical protein